jgi:hypothetical protein
MRILNVEEMESSIKMDLRDVKWWMSIKDACRLGAPVMAKFSKGRCISLVAKGGPSRFTCR